MKILLSKKSDVVGYLVAWKGPNDPSAGDFSLSLDPSSNLQFVIWHAAKPYCRISMLKGVSVVSSIYQNTIVFEAIISIGDRFYYEYTVPDGSPYIRVTLEYTGALKTLSWNNRSSWTVLSEPPASSYEVYATCGCRRTKALKCSEQSHFVTIPWMKVPDKFLVVPNKSFDECRVECSSNCSCTAYAYTNFTNNATMADQSRCLVWTGNLVDAMKYRMTGENLYLRLAGSPVQENSKLVKTILPIVAILLILICIALIKMWKSTKRHNKGNQKRLMLGYMGSSNEIGDENAKFPFVSFEDILVATDNFSDSNKLEKGALAKFTSGYMSPEYVMGGKAMNSDASLDEEYGPMELDQMIQDEFFDSSDSDEEVDMIMLMGMQEEKDRQVEHILNFKGSIKGRRVINLDRCRGNRSDNRG
nr:receptor-like serine/threonine-protein kinase SD1-8 [Aegilops tauschii subsp. strangulata]